MVYNNSINVIISICINSISVFGIVFAGLFANNKYTYLSTIRSTPQFISSELILGILIMTIMCVSNSFNYVDIAHNQICVWNIIIMGPVYLMFLSDYTSRDRYNFF